MTSLINKALIGLTAALLACRPSPQEVSTDQQTTAAGHQYTVFYPNQLPIRVVTTRPDPGRSPCQLSVAAAYTDLDTDQPLDLLVDNGRVRQTQARVGFLDGVLTITGDSLRITRIPGGQTPPGEVLEQVRRQNGTLLLQELLVYEGRVQRPAGGSAFQRRALVELPQRRFVVIESAADDLTLQQFAADLLELGARNALYLDMGDWDEGWYKEGGEVVVLGLRRTETARQSNWLVFGPPR